MSPARRFYFETLLWMKDAAANRPEGDAHVRLAFYLAFTLYCQASAIEASDAWRLKTILRELADEPAT